MGESFTLDSARSSTPRKVQLTYVTPAGAVVHVEFLGEQGGSSGAGDNCDFAGIVYAG